MIVRLSPVASPWIHHVRDNWYRLDAPEVKVDPIMREVLRALGSSETQEQGPRVYYGYIQMSDRCSDDVWTPIEREDG